MSDLRTGSAHRMLLQEAFAGLFFLVGPLLYFAENAVQVLVPLLTAMAFAFVQPSWRARLRPFYIRHGLILVFCLWALASATWSIDPALSIERGLRLSVEVLVGLSFLAVTQALDADLRSAVVRATSVGFAIAPVVVLLIVAVEWASGSRGLWDAARTTSAFSQGAAIHAMVAGPLFVTLWRDGDRRLALSLAASILLAAGVVNNMAARIAIGTGAMVAIIVYAQPALRHVLYAGVIATIVVGPLVMPVAIKNSAACALVEGQASALHRFGIWAYVRSEIDQRPVTGMGLGGARLLSELEGRVDLTALCPDGLTEKQQKRRLKQALPTHPHNNVLQVWLELGAVGAAIAAMALMVALAGQSARRPSRAQFAGFATGLAAMFVIANLSYGVWQGWWVASLFLAIAFLRQALQPVDR